ncbi:MAG: class I tRNA ligase family protein, partial [Clostridiales bacterium]|nr:class I tRNA ligase family protein [Clostridiales bacterium]
AWYCADCGHISVSRDDITECEKCKSHNISRDEDVLDTWFSSALWPFSTLGWPDKTPDLDYFYPTDVLVTAYDIIFFWVARMIFSGCEHTKQIPFHSVFIHGLIRDDKGHKMSKSLGNGIDPLEMIDRFGCDALRFNLVTGNSPGNDMRFYTERCEAMRNFANKIWNASRFVMMNLSIDRCELPEKLEPEDMWILSKLNAVAKEVSENMDAYELGVAAQKVSDFIWDSYCDWYIELTKPRLNGEDEENSIRAQKVLLYVLTEIMKLLHPFMPFITEEIWQALPHEGDFLMLCSFPEYNEALSFPNQEHDFEALIDAIKAIRSRRADMNVPPSRRARLIVVTDNKDIFENGRAFLIKLAYASEVLVTDTAPDDIEGMVSVITDKAKMFMPMAELVDLKKERERLEKEIAKAQKEYDAQMAKLNNEKFLAKAPASVVENEKERAKRAKALIENLSESLLKLK